MPDCSIKTLMLRIYNYLHGAIPSKSEPAESNDG